MTLKRYLDDLVQLSNLELQAHLPEVYYMPVMASLSAAYQHLFVQASKEHYERYLKASVTAIVGFTRVLLPFIPTAPSLFTVPLRALLHDGLNDARADALKALAEPFRQPDTYAYFNYSPYATIRSSWSIEDEKERKQARKEEDKLEEDIRDILGSHQYYLNTLLDRSPFHKHGDAVHAIFNIQVPYPLDDQVRFEHHWIIAGSGHGKTQTLQRFLVEDLKKVANGEASVIVMDSQDQLIKNIVALEAFAPGRILSDRLVWIDPTDVEWPVQLNLFDLGSHRPKTMLERERLVNSTLELYMFVLGSLLGSELTSKQEVVFKYVMRLMLFIPGASIQTLRELFELGGYEKYKPHIDQLQGTARAFFENEFEGKQFELTRKEVLRRLYGILSDQVFERMFSHPTNKLDLAAEMNAGKVILINTAKDLLKETGTEIFGRFFVALITQAAQERAPLSRKLPCFVYIDECQDYIANDKNLKLILEQARKQNIGLVLAHQYLSQVGTAYDALSANTSIKMAGGTSDADAHALARNMKTTPDMILDQPKFSFATYVRNKTRAALTTTITPGLMEDYPRHHDLEAIRKAQRAKYATHHSEVDRYINAEPELTSKNQEADNQDVSPMEDPKVVPIVASSRKQKPADDIDLSPAKN